MPESIFRNTVFPPKIAKCGFSSIPVHQKQVYWGPGLTERPRSYPGLVYIFTKNALGAQQKLFVGREDAGTDQVTGNQRGKGGSREDGGKHHELIQRGIERRGSGK